MVELANARSVDLLIGTDGPITAGSLGRFLQHLEPVVRRGAGAKVAEFRLELTELEQGSVKMKLLVLGGAASVATILQYVGLEIKPRGNTPTTLSRSAANMIVGDKAQSVTITGPGAVVIFDQQDAEEVKRLEAAPPVQLQIATEEPVRHLVAPQTGLVHRVGDEYFIRLREGRGPLCPS